MTESPAHVRVIEETPAYWRVVFDYPPFNIVDASIFEALQDLLARMDASPSSPGFGQISYLEHSPTSILGSGLGEDAAPRMVQLKAQLQFQNLHNFDRSDSEFCPASISFSEVLHHPHIAIDAPASNGQMSSVGGR
jgi:hypothetical protein